MLVYSNAQTISLIYTNITIDMCGPMKRLSITLILLYSLFISPAALSETVRLNVTSPEQTTYAETFLLPGTFIARNEIAIGSPLQQQMVIDVLVEEGQWVEKNQLLAILESPIQNASVSQLQAETEKATAYIKQQKVVAEQAQKELSRLTPLAKTGAISTNDFEKAKSESLAALALLDANKAELRQLQAQLVKEKSQQEKSRIVAPISGVISERHAIRGMLSDNQLLFKIIENGEIEFDALAHISELKRLSSLERIQLKILNNQIITGKLRYLSPKIDPISQQGRIRISLDENRDNLQAGESGTAIISNAEKLQTTLPYSAIRTLDNGERIIFIVVNNKVKQQKVTTGKIHNGRIEILSPISSDIFVVTNAQAFLTENDTVSPVKDRQ